MNWPTLIPFWGQSGSPGEQLHVEQVNCLWGIQNVEQNQHEFVVSHAIYIATEQKNTLFTVELIYLYSNSS